jgi:hypothetical protein
VTTRLRQALERKVEGTAASGMQVQKELEPNGYIGYIGYLIMD